MTSFKIRRTKINNDIAMSAPQAFLCCKNSPPECGARGGIARRETIISSPTGEGAMHVNIFQNYCKITKNKCVARWGLARKGGVICYQ